MVALMMPLSMTQAPSLSVTVTGALTFGLATRGRASPAQRRRGQGRCEDGRDAQDGNSRGFHAVPPVGNLHGAHGTPLHPRRIMIARPGRRCSGSSKFWARFPAWAGSSFVTLRRRGAPLSIVEASLASRPALKHGPTGRSPVNGAEIPGSPVDRASACRPAVHGGPGLDKAGPCVVCYMPALALSTFFAPCFAEGIGSPALGP